MKQDRFLTAILAAILLLVAVALVLFFTRRESQSYTSDDTPTGVTRNYVLALQKGDYEKSYAYLKESSTRPAFTLFKQAFVNHELDISSAAVHVGEETISDKHATVSMIITHAGGAFDSGYRDIQSALLVLEGGRWKLESMPNPYWGWNWYQNPAMLKQTQPGN